MHRAFAATSRLTAGSRATAILIVALVASLLLAWSPSATAQESTPEAAPGATPAAGATPTAGTEQLGEVLMQAEFDTLPNAPMTVRLLRITLAPGASVPMHTHPGIEFDLIESGSLTARASGDALISADGSQFESSEPQVLPAGSWVMYPDGVGMSFTNEGEEDVVILSAVVLAVGGEGQSTITYTEGDPTDADFEGVSFVVLGDGLIQQFPEGPATITIDRLAVPAAQPVPGFTGAALLSKTTGTFAFAAGEGAVQVTRTATPQLQPNAIPGQEFTLADNDAAFFPAGYEAIERADSTDELTITRLLIQSDGDLADAPATVTAIQAEVAATEGEPAGDGIGVGAIIAISEDGVNLRAEASTESEIVDSYPAGTQFELIGGPTEGEDYTWYQVRGVGDLSDIEGWLVTDFMDVIEPAAAGAQADGDGSSGETAAAATPSPAAAEGEFAAGDTVVTTTENLRIRTDPSTEGEPLTTLPLGTELEIISGPEEAEELTWYEVQVVGQDTTGWVAADFLEASGE